MLIAHNVGVTDGDQVMILIGKTLPCKYIQVISNLGAAIGGGGDGEGECESCGDLCGGCKVVGGCSSVRDMSRRSCDALLDEAGGGGGAFLAGGGGADLVGPVEGG